MRSEAERFCAEIYARTNPRWLSLLGPSGVGKTLLSRLIFEFVQGHARYFKIRGATGDFVVQEHPTRWVNWRRAGREMKTGDFSTAEILSTPNWERDHAIWFAVIDDVGAADETSRAYLLNAIDSVVDARLGQWTVISSNLFLSQIHDVIDSRIASRMVRDRNVVVEINAQDYSLRNR